MDNANSQESPELSETTATAENGSANQSNQLPLSQFTFNPEEQKSLLRTVPVASGQPAAPIPMNREMIVSPPLPLAPAISPQRTLSGPARLLVAALGLGGMVDALLYGQQPGIGVSLFALLALGALIGLALRENLRANLHAIFITGVPLIFFTGMIAVRDNGFLTFLNSVVSLFLAGLLAHFFAGGRLVTVGVGGFLGLPWLSFGNTIIGAAPAVRKVSDDHAGRSEGRRKWLPVLRGLVIAAPILAVLVPLLVSADAAFAQQAERLFGWLFPENWGERVWRITLIIGSAWGIAGGFVYALTRQEREGITQKTPGQPLGFTEGMVPLALVCTLFGGFLLVQAEYLFGGSVRVQAVPGLTYADYARRGFGELVTVAALTLTLALTWQRLMRREGGLQIRLFKGSVTLLVGLTLVTLASAYQRMSAYEAAYGATETRLYVDAFIVFLSAVLVWFAVTLWTEKERYFAFGGFLCVLAYVASINLLNPDAAVARTNIARSLPEKQTLDSYTMRRLSDDAIPALCAALDRATGAERTQLAAVLRHRLTEREVQRKQVGWPSWNLSRENAFRQLRSRAGSLPVEADADRQFDSD